MVLKWLFAKYYDRIMQKAEDKGLRDWRRQLLHGVSGEVLELGSGTGANIEYYPAELKRLVLSEPSSFMYSQLKERVAQSGKPYVELNVDPGEKLSLADNSFDYVVITLVLCSVNDMEKTLAEIRRVLRPQGKLIFLEHVAAENNPNRYRWQRRLEFIWKHLAGGCHVTRQTQAAITEAGFKILDLNQQSIRGVPPIVRPSIRGVAVKT